MLAAKKAMATADGFKIAMGAAPGRQFFRALTGDAKLADEMAANAEGEAMMRQTMNGR